MQTNEMNTKLRVNFAGRTKKGSGEQNDDAFAAYAPTTPRELHLKGATACIADGLSGSSNARIASQLACETVVTDYYSTAEFWSVKRAVATTIQALNDWFIGQSPHRVSEDQQQDSVWRSAYMTTISCLVIKSNTAHIFHLGDSRIYLLRDGGLEQLTQDHIAVHRGIDSYLTKALGLQTAVALDYFKVAVRPGDRFVLTTDGVHQSLSHKALNQFCADPALSLMDIANAIVGAATVAEPHDDATVLLVEPETLPDLELREILGDYSSSTIPPLLKVGERIDEFKVIERLATDARSLIYRVVSEENDQQYVLKAPAKDQSADLEYLEGFALEQWLAGKLSSPYLMKVYPRNENSQFFYHLCEWIPGLTLRQKMQEKGVFTLPEVQSLLHAMIKAVRALHRAGIVHRDLKPENFLYDENGVLKLIDFGSAEFASLTDGISVPTQQTPPGDIGYMAPEYLVEGRGTMASDLFSLATIVYELLTTQLPYAAILDNQDSPRQYDYWRYRPIAANSKFSPYLPYWVNNVLKKALSPEPENRYQSLSEFEQSLASPPAEILKRFENTPLLHANPLRFYQGLSLLLILIIIVQNLMPYL